MRVSRTGRGPTQAAAEAALKERMRILYAQYLKTEPIANVWEVIRREHDISFGEGGTLIHAITQWVRV